MEHTPEHRTSLLAGLLLGLLLTPARGEVVDRVVAQVDDQVITLTDLNWFIRWRGFQIPAPGPERDSFLREVLTQLINQRLVMRESSRTPIASTSAAEVEEFFGRYRSQFPDEQEFGSRLRELGMSEPDLRAIIRRQIAVNKFIQYRFEPFVIVLPDDIRDYYANEFVPELEKEGQVVPPLSLVQETIRQILSVRRTTDRLENWLQSARARTHISDMLFRDDLEMPNLPGQYKGTIKMTDEPFAPPPSANR